MKPAALLVTYSATLVLAVPAPQNAMNAPSQRPKNVLDKQTKPNSLRPWRQPAPSKDANPEEYARLCRGPNPKEARHFRKSEQCVGTREWCRNEYYLHVPPPNQWWDWYLSPYLCMESREPAPRA